MNDERGCSLFTATTSTSCQYGFDTLFSEAFNIAIDKNEKTMLAHAGFLNKYFIIRIIFNFFSKAKIEIIREHKKSGYVKSRFSVIANDAPVIGRAENSRHCEGADRSNPGIRTRYPWIASFLPMTGSLPIK
jgi:hypothetical protein